MHTRKFDPTTQSLYSLQGIIVDLECPTAEFILKAADDKFMFNPRTKWLLLDINQKFLGLKNNSPKWKYVQDLYFLPDSDITIATMLNKKMTEYSIFKSAQNSNLKIFSKDDTKSQRINLDGIDLKSATVIFHQNEFCGMESLYMKHLDTFPKMHYFIVKNLADQLNFTLQLQILNDYGWETNGSFTSVMGLLEKRQIDMAATGFFIRDDRMRVADFTAETYLIKTAVIFRQPPLSNVANIFTLPFTPDVWYSCICISIVILFTFYIQIFCSRLGKMNVEFQNGGSMMDLVTLVIGCICQQGSFMVPRMVSTKLTLLVLSIASWFLLTSYSANIVALLQSPGNSLKTVSDLAESSLKVGIQDLNYNRVYFKESTDKSTKKLYTFKIAPYGTNAFFAPNKGIQNVRIGYFAYQVEVALGYQLISDTFTEREKCGLSEMKLFPIPVLALPLIKHSGYRDVITQKIRWQREVGILNQIAHKWLPPKPQCESNRGFVTVGLTEFLPALRVLFYGMLGAFVIFVFEFLHYNRGDIFKVLIFENKKKKQKKKTPLRLPLRIK